MKPCRNSLVILFILLIVSDIVFSFDKGKTLKSVQIVSDILIVNYYDFARLFVY